MYIITLGGHSIIKGKIRQQTWFSTLSMYISSVQFSHSVMSDSLQPHESQHARPPCPSPTPWVHSDSCPSSQWCHPAISSSVASFPRLKELKEKGGSPLPSALSPVLDSVKDVMWGLVATILWPQGDKTNDKKPTHRVAKWKGWKWLDTGWYCWDAALTLKLSISSLFVLWKN